MPGCDQLKMARLPEFGILARSMRLLRMVYSCLHSGSRTQQVITTRTTGLDASTPADRRIATNESPITIEYLCEYPRGVSCVHMACGAMSGGARIHAVWPLSSVARRNRLRQIVALLFAGNTEARMLLYDLFVCRTRGKRREF
jgi:hypothetical protein